jgi:hypothetical protein
LLLLFANGVGSIVNQAPKATNTNATGGDEVFPELGAIP